jgi:hypothetical protein
MDYQAWTLDLKTLTATHTSGFTLQWEGSAKDPSAVHPGRFSKELTAIEGVRLLRHGVEFIAKSAAPAMIKKTSYVAPANKPNRPKLSLKPRKGSVA